MVGGGRRAPGTISGVSVVADDAENGNGKFMNVDNVRRDEEMGEVRHGDRRRRRRRDDNGNLREQDENIRLDPTLSGDTFAERYTRRGGPGGERNY